MTECRRRMPEILRPVLVTTVAARWKSEFEWYAHARMARDNGISDELIAAIGSGDGPTWRRNLQRRRADRG